MAKQTLHAYVVAGRGTFPFDMLRYDAAWPRDDAAVASLREQGATYRVKLMSNLAPTVARWATFGAIVSDHTSRKLES